MALEHPTPSWQAAGHIWTDLRGDSQELFVESAMAYIEIQQDGMLDSIKDQVKIQTMDIEGNTCYYIVAHYDFEGHDYQRIYAACDVGEGNVYYSVQASVIDEEVELSMEVIKEFFIFK